MKKPSNIDNISHKTIMYLIYIRTILELCVRYDKDGVILEHRLTPTAFMAYKRICDIERTIYQKSQTLKQRYIEAHTICKPVWAKSLNAMGIDYSIHIEPLAATLYTTHEKELKRIGLLPALFMGMYDFYFAKYNCELEVESVAPIDIIEKETEKALFEFKKDKKRRVA